MIKLSRAIALTMIVAALGLASIASADSPQKGPKKVTPGKMKSFKPSGKKINLKPSTMHKKTK